MISAGGKWTITALVKVLNALKIDYRVIHDTDRKGLTDEQLEEKAAIHPFKANAKIASVANADNVFLVDDTFEHVLWDQVEARKPNQQINHITHGNVFETILTAK
ncbi:predicted ATP-dependent endonuclease OLD family [Vibrio astriarenae]|nr:predicted ATP-dependent endonuclease OLD family [Vibrio sp. C7]